MVEIDYIDEYTVRQRKSGHHYANCYGTDTPYELHAPLCGQAVRLIDCEDETFTSGFYCADCVRRLWPNLLW